MKKNILLVVLTLIFLASFAGCNNAEVVEPVASEPASSSEEVSEEVTEEVSEEPSEETKEVKIVNFSSYHELVDYMNIIGKTSILEFSFAQEGSSQFIIPNGTSYTMQLTNALQIFPYKEASAVVSNVDGIKPFPAATPNAWALFIETTGTDIEVSATIMYTDGTEEDILLYVTNTFE